MELDKLTKTQIVWLCLLIALVTATATSIVTVTLVRQAPPPFTQTINKVIERTIGAVVEDKKEEKLNEPVAPREDINNFLTKEEAVVKVVKDISPAVVSIIATKDLPVIEQYFVDPFGGDDFLNELFPG